MIEKHNRKLFLHNNILKYLKSLSKEELSSKIILLNSYLENSQNEYSTKEKWKEIISDFNLKNFSKIILKKNNEGELLRQTSPLGIIIPQEKIIFWKKKWEKNRK